MLVSLWTWIAGEFWKSLSMWDRKALEYIKQSLMRDFTQYSEDQNIDRILNSKNLGCFC